MKTFSASDANRHFSRLLREVAQGETVTVLSRGKPVATIAPAGLNRGCRDQAKRALLSRLRQQKPTGGRDWSRDELYER